MPATVINSICQYIQQQITRPKKDHTRTLHNMIIAAYHALTNWVLEYQCIVEDRRCLKNVLRVAYLGLTGAESSAPLNKSRPGWWIRKGTPKYLGIQDVYNMQEGPSGRVIDAASLLLMHTTTLVSDPPAPLAFLAEEMRLLAPLAGGHGRGHGQPPHTASRYFVFDKETLIAIVPHAEAQSSTGEAAVPPGHTAAADPGYSGGVIIMRDQSGRFAWDIANLYDHYADGTQVAAAGKKGSFRAGAGPSPEEAAAAALAEMEAAAVAARVKTAALAREASEAERARAAADAIARLPTNVDSLLGNAGLDRTSFDAPDVAVDAVSQEQIHSVMARHIRVARHQRENGTGYSAKPPDLKAPAYAQPPPCARLLLAHLGMWRLSNGIQMPTPRLRSAQSASTPELVEVTPTNATVVTIETSDSASSLGGGAAAGSVPGPAFTGGGRGRGSAARTRTTYDSFRAKLAELDKLSQRDHVAINVFSIRPDGTPVPREAMEPADAAQKRFWQFYNELNTAHGVHATRAASRLRPTTVYATEDLELSFEVAPPPSVAGATAGAPHAHTQDVACGARASLLLLAGAGLGSAEPRAGASGGSAAVPDPPVSIVWADNPAHFRRFGLNNKTSAILVSQMESNLYYVSTHLCDEASAFHPPHSSGLVPAPFVAKWPRPAPSSSSFSSSCLLFCPFFLFPIPAIFVWQIFGHAHLPFFVWQNKYLDTYVYPLLFFLCLCAFWRSRPATPAALAWGTPASNQPR